MFPSISLMVSVLSLPAAVSWPARWGTGHPAQGCQGSAEGGLGLCLSLSASVPLNIKMKQATSLFKFGDLCNCFTGTLSNNDTCFTISIPYREVKQSPQIVSLFCAKVQTFTSGRDCWLAFSAVIVQRDHSRPLIWARGHPSLTTGQMIIQVTLGQHH